MFGIKRTTKIRYKMKKNEIQKYRKYSRDIMWFLKVSGICFDSNLYLQILTVSLAISSVSFTFSGAVTFCLSNFSDLMVFTRTLGLVISLFSTLLKISTFLCHQEDITSLENILTTSFNEDLKNKELQDLVLTRYRAIANLFYTLTSSVGILSFVTSILMPLLALKHGKYVPIIPSIYPFSYEPGSFVYWLIQLTNVMAAFYVWTVTCGVDSVFGLYTLQMCGELRILSHKFESLKLTSDYELNLKKCMRRHQILMKSRDMLEEIFGFLSIWLAVTSAVSQCTLIFQATEILKSMNPPKMTFIIVFITVKLVQAFMYAWYGSLIAEESNRCLDSIYKAAWLESNNKRMTKDVLFVLLQRPLKFVAKGWIKLDMPFFSKILQTSVSYFFLLRTLKEDSTY